MYQKDAEVLFPARFIGVLRDLRGAEWRQLIERVMVLPESDPDALAFVLLMIRLDGCLSCQADSFRALRGCGTCATQTVSRFKGSDDDLLRAYESARQDMLRWLQVGVAPRVE